VRIKDGVTIPQVQGELNMIAARIARQYPKDEEKMGFKLSRPGLMGDFFGAPARGFLTGVMGLAGIVLLPGLREGSFCACGGCIHHGGDRIPFGRRAGETRPAHRSSTPAP
jgi:hypothetical protein